jgi:ectoine hydroxylase-related dioxygenase (phytanoyl-CoA dioxygenase family)
MANSPLYDQWRELGYVVVPQLINVERATQLREICDAIYAQWRDCDPQTGQPGEKPDATVMRHLNHPAYFAQHAEWLPVVLEAAADPGVLRVAEAIFTEPPLFRCTSLFFNPSGINLDGNWHRDAQFMTKTDGEERTMVLNAGDGGSGMQLQIALTPSDDIEVVPGSHLRWDTSGEYAIRKADGGAHNRSNDMPGAVRVRQGVGDAVLFNAMAIHRGRYHSMLTYTKISEPWFDYFSDQPWFLRPGYLDGLRPNTRAFYERFIAQYESHWRSTIPSSLTGEG